MSAQPMEMPKTIEQLEQRIKFLSEENDELADANLKLEKDLEIAKRKGEITLEPATASMFKRFIEDANSRREKAGQRQISDTCYWASDLIDKGIKALRGQWKSGDGYRATKGLLEAAVAAKVSGDDSMVLTLISQLQELKRKA